MTPTTSSSHTPAAGSDERESVGSRVVIFKTPASPFWYMQFNHNGRQYRPSLRTKSKKEAKRLALAKDAELVLGQATLPAARGADLETQITTFLDHVRGKDRNPQTVILYKQYLHQFRDWADEHAVRRLDQLDLQTLENYQQALIKGGFTHRRGCEEKEVISKPNKRRTVRNKMKTIRSLLRWALRRGILTKDPASGYELPPKAKDQAYCFTAADLIAIFNKAEAEYKDIFQFLAMTGLRVSEMLYLTKADVDLKEGFISIRTKTIPETGERWTPKHGNERIVPLTRESRAIVEGRMTESPGPWVFAAPSESPTKTGRLHYQRVRKALCRAKKAAGVEQGKIHSFRHSFCSHLAREPHVTAFDAMKLMGHTSLDIILVYFHTTREHLVSVMSKVSFSSILTGVAEVGKGKEGELAQSQQSPQS